MFFDLRIANLLVRMFIVTMPLLIYVKVNLLKAFINKGFGGFNSLIFEALKSA